MMIYLLVNEKSITAAQGLYNAVIIKQKSLQTMMFTGFYFGRGEWIRTTGLYVPNVALYQTKLHLALF